MDDEIIDLFFNRDEAAISKTRTLYGARLRQFAFNILKSNEDAEESESDTYLKAWNTIPPQKPRYFYAYLAKICRFIAFGKLDWKNAQKRKAEIVELTAEMELCIPSKNDGFNLESEEIGQLLNDFLKTLTQENRLIFMRRYWFADSIYDIAHRLKISESKVKTALFRTRNTLKGYLESEGLRI